MAEGTIFVENRDSADLFVTIIDRNTAAGDELWKDKRLNENESLPLQCEIDGDYRANLDWVAKRADDSSVSGSGSEMVDEGSTLEVDAN